jgi:hypothetical protein
LGRDVHSFIENPNFKDAPNFDFRFKNNKSIRKINFKPFNYLKSGVYGSETWIAKSKLPKYIIDAFDQAVEENMKRE